MVFLVDTSVWIKHFSRRDPFDLRGICQPEERVLCLPVYQEILQGVRDESSFRQMQTALRAGRCVETPMTRSLYDEAVALYRLARRQGLTVRSSVDCLIAACAIRHDLVVLHSDRDYAALAAVSALREQAVLP
ncbi:MAG: PIN domain nuclease [Spirochaetaceae bacterium]|nr:MAG: PIN domain nuclease [Spirochaetaceae bacterium]